jgi:hypothetical protein
VLKSKKKIIEKTLEKAGPSYEAKLIYTMELTDCHLEEIEIWSGVKKIC